jgi:arylsulfatase A-like enzyme
MPFNSMDVMPTLLDLCGVEVPATVEGRSMVEDFLGRADPVEDAALFSCIVPIGSWSKKAGGREYRGVRTARYTYVRDLRGPWLLYDTDVDPLQQENLCGRDQWRQVQNALDRVLQRKLDEVGDEFRSAEEYAAKWGYDLEPWGY